jgi:GTP-dependent phosphoenolpyruvate carboxykinase
MLDPTPIHKNWDYRNFGDMFFDLKNDSLELDNKIDGKQYKSDINKLRNYYEEFVKNVPSTGKDEWVQQKLKKQ